MRISLDATTATLRLDFDDDAALGSFAAGWRRNNGCLVRLTEALKLWTELTVELRAGARRLAVEARVVQVFGGGQDGFATALEATETASLEAFESAEPGAAPRPANEPPAALDEPGGGHAAAGEPPPKPATHGVAGEMRGASPVFRIRQMNVSQKMRLAATAGRSERQILLRDGSPQVLMGLLSNPRLEDKEVLSLAKNPSASSGVLQRIAKDRRWTPNYEIRLALVRNPQTPTPLALQMLETLREGDLRKLAKGSMVREAIRAAAVRRVVKR